MNNSSFILLIRRDHALELAAHLVAGLLVLGLATGFVRMETISAVNLPAPVVQLADVASAPFSMTLVPLEPN